LPPASGAAHSDSAKAGPGWCHARIKRKLFIAGNSCSPPWHAVCVLAVTARVIKPSTWQEPQRRCFSLPAPLPEHRRQGLRHPPLPGAALLAESQHGRGWKGPVWITSCISPLAQPSSASAPQRGVRTQTQRSTRPHRRCRRSIWGVLSVHAQPFPGAWVRGVEQGRGSAAPREMQFSFAPVRDRARPPLEPGLRCEALPVHGIQSQSRAGTSPQPGAKGKGSQRGSPPPQPGEPRAPAQLRWAPDPHSFISTHSPTTLPERSLKKPHILYDPA